MKNPIWLGARHHISVTSFTREVIGNSLFVEISTNGRVLLPKKGFPQAGKGVVYMVDKIPLHWRPVLRIKTSGEAKNMTFFSPRGLSGGKRQIVFP